MRLDPADLDASEEYRQAFETERNIAPPHAMRASIEHLQREYGGIRPYLTGAGVTEEELGAAAGGYGGVRRAYDCATPIPSGPPYL